MDEPVYVAFLLGVERNAVVFATYTHYETSLRGHLELRHPSEMSKEAFTHALEAMDRAALTVSDWQSLHHWIGREKGTWAMFTAEAAHALVPHWFSEPGYICRSVSEDGQGPFQDVYRSSTIQRDQWKRFEDLAGDLTSPDGDAYFFQTISNLTITRQSLFEKPREDESSTDAKSTLD